MEQGYRRGKRSFLGKLVSLALFAEEHSKALEYDLLTRTNYQLNDVGGRLSWSALSSFIENLKTDSAVAQDLGKSTGWEDTLTTNRILADIYDLLQVINANIVGMGGKKIKVKPYPRPGKKEDNIKKIGNNAMPYNQLLEWFKNKRGEYNGRK